MGIPVYVYSNALGYEDNKIKLLKKPKGMYLLDNNIIWIPKDTDAGKHYEIEVEISKDNKTVKLNFDLNVSTVSKPMKLEIQGNTLRVVDDLGCFEKNLYGKNHEFLITVPDKLQKYLKDIVIQKIENSRFIMPSDVHQDSCMFTISGMSFSKENFPELADAPLELQSLEFPIPGEYTIQIPNTVPPKNTILYNYTIDWTSSYAKTSIKSLPRKHIFSAYEINQQNIVNTSYLQGIYLIGNGSNGKNFKKKENSSFSKQINRTL